MEPGEPEARVNRADRIEQLKDGGYAILDFKTGTAPSAKQVRIVCKLSPNLLRIEIADQGPGFDPQDVPDPTADENLEKPGGRGVMLMRAYMDKVTFNRRGNRVSMVKLNRP